MTLARELRIPLAPVVMVGRSERFVNYGESRRNGSKEASAVGPLQIEEPKRGSGRGTTKEETDCGLLIVTVIITSEPRKTASLSL